MKVRRGLILFVLFVLSQREATFGQEAIIYTKGQAITTTVSATSDSQFFTKHGNFYINEIDSLVTDNSALKDRFSKGSSVPVRPKPLTYQSKNKAYLDDMPFDEKGQLIYSEVVISSDDQNELYKKAKEFFVKTFKSANDVIQYDDKEAATIIGKGWSAINFTTGIFVTESSLYYTIKIQCKDQKYRYEISSLYFKSIPTQYVNSVESPVESTFLKSVYYKKNGQPKEINNKYKVELQNKVNELINSIKTVMTQNRKTDEW